MGHRRSFRGSNANRRKKLWANLDFIEATGDVAITDFSPPDIVGVGDSLAATFFSANQASAVVEGTLLRIRGYIDIPKSTITNIDPRVSSTVYAFGIGMVTDEAAQVADAIPNPATIIGADWDGWMFLRSSSQVSLDSVGTRLDVRAKRKFQSGTSLVFVAGLATNDPAGVVANRFLGSFRGLFLLP